jgi:hypothetical protein
VITFTAGRLFCPEFGPPFPHRLDSQNPFTEARVDGTITGTESAPIGINRVN